MFVEVLPGWAGGKAASSRVGDPGVKSHFHPSSQTSDSSSSSSAFPAIFLRFTILGGIFAYVTVFLIQPSR